MSLFPFFPSFYMSQLRHRKVTKLTQGHSSENERSQTQAPAPVLVITHPFSGGRSLWALAWEFKSTIFCYRFHLWPSATLRDCLNLKSCWQVFWVHFQAGCMISFFIMSLIHFTLLRWCLQGIIMTLFPRLIFLFSFINCLMSAGHKYKLEALWKPKILNKFQ